MSLQSGSTASKSDKWLPFPIGGHESSSVIELQMQHPVPSPRAEGTSRRRFEYPRNMEPDTASLVNDTKFFDMDRSSAVFTSNGPKRTKLQAYSVRISELRHIAADDGYSLSLTSESDFWLFVVLETRLRKGNLVLMDNGNLRAVWKDDQGTRLGLQFLGGGMVQYVIFKQRESTQPISRVTGRDTFAGVRCQIEAFELHALLYQ